MRLPLLLAICRRFPRLSRPLCRLAFALLVGRRGVYWSRWYVGVQRRSVYLVPPDFDDLQWMFELFHAPEISEMFGYHDLGAPVMLLRYRAGTLVVAIIKSVETRKRIGFLIMYPPAGFSFWEFGYAIPDSVDRNAFNALNTTDAVGHYMFEILRVPACGWRTREDNRAADAVVRRLGYVAGETIQEEGHRYIIYSLDREGWQRRLKKLSANQTREGGDVPLFRVLKHPYLPVPASE